MRATQRITEAIATMRMFKSKYDKKATSRTPLKALRYDFALAIQALEKQVAKKPIMQSTDEKKIYKCPCCNKIFFEAYDTVQRGYIPKYCEMCGQSIDF